jgi:endonuclease-3
VTRVRISAGAFLKMKKRERIEKVMQNLEKYFQYKKRTTLNRMRRNPDAFKILISCLLSLRTQDKNTEKASKALFKVADTPEKILQLSDKKLEKLIYSSGHYKKKAKTIKHVSKILIEKYKGKVPDKKEELLKIKGIGPKTANIVLAFAFGQSVLPIDTHCHRIPNRLGWVKTKTPEQTEKELEKILPKKYWTEFNAIFVVFGKTICQPISPFCSRCPIRKYCMRRGVKRSR